MTFTCTVERWKAGRMCFVSQPMVATAVQILMNNRTAGRRELWYQGACNHSNSCIPSQQARLWA